MMVVPEGLHFHSQVTIDGRMVDEGMADLMQAVWGYGIRTVECCQGGTEKVLTWAWVQFWDIPDAVKFLEGTGYLSDWQYTDAVHMYLTPPLLLQAGPSPLVRINYSLLPEITKLWVEGTAKPPAPVNKE